LTTDEK
jgi:hypothetical protein